MILVQSLYVCRNASFDLLLILLFDVSPWHGVSHLPNKPLIHDLSLW